MCGVIKCKSTKCKCDSMYSSYCGIPCLCSFGWDESVGIEQKLDIWFGPSSSVNLIPPGAFRLFFQHNTPTALRINLHLRSRDTSLFSSKESNSSENCRMHLSNATFQLSINFMHNRTKHCSNCICIRSVWYYIGKQCWTTHFYFTEQENRASVVLAGGG